MVSNRDRSNLDSIVIWCVFKISLSLSLSPHRHNIYTCTYLYIYSFVFVQIAWIWNFVFLCILCFYFYTRNCLNSATNIIHSFSWIWIYKLILECNKRSSLVYTKHKRYKASFVSVLFILIKASFITHV